MMDARNPVIKLAHGAGGRQSRQLTDDLFARYLNNPFLDTQNDGAVLPWDSDQLVMTTDSFVVDPLFFPGGDIGKLAVCGTVNDLTVMGAEPLYLSAGFILEEGFPLRDLERCLGSMQQSAEEAGVSIVTGDTKVVPWGKADGLFINTAGVGRIMEDTQIRADRVQMNDQIIITGPIGLHGMAVMSARGHFEFKIPVLSDAAPLNTLIKPLIEAGIEIHAMRDATRGGLAAVLNELSAASGVGILVDEAAVPVPEAVRSACDILGFDVFYVANEGVIVMTLPEHESEKALRLLKKHHYGKQSAIVGRVTEAQSGRVLLKTPLGTHRILDLRSGEQLPRIC